MADYKYSYNGPEEGTAKAVLLDAPISTKVAIEIANFLKGKSTSKAITYLELVMQKKEAIPFKRFTDGVGHKKGSMDAGRFPFKASEYFIKLISMVEANASHKNMDDELVIKHLMVHKASSPFHQGRQGRRKMKRSHVEIVVEEDKTNLAKSKSSPKSSPKSISKSTKQEDKTKKDIEKEAEPEVKTTAKKESEKELKDSKLKVEKEIKDETKKYETPKIEEEKLNPTKKETEKTVSNKGETQ